MDNQDKKLLEFGEELLTDHESGHHILFLSIIGEIEGMSWPATERKPQNMNICCRFWPKRRTAEILTASCC